MLKELREALGLAPAELAEAVGISREAYYDLEEHETDLQSAVGVGTVARLAGKLRIKPSILYGSGAGAPLSMQVVANRLKDHVRSMQESLDEFEAQVGWGIRDVLDRPEAVLEMTPDELCAVCSAIGVDWLAVLDGLPVE